jgi:hypothetical protein
MGARYSEPLQTGPGAQTVSGAIGTGSFPGVESGRGVTLTPHPLLVPMFKQSRAIPLLSLRTFMACKKGETYNKYHTLGKFLKDICQNKPRPKSFTISTNEIIE